jgi:hypothetical protein
MRQSWIVATLVALLGAAPDAQAQSALDKLKAAEQASKKPKSPEEKAKAEAAKAKAEADKAKAEAEKAKAEAEKAKAEAEKAKAEAEKAKADAGAPPPKDAGAPDAAKADGGKTDASRSSASKPEEALDDKDAPAALIKLRSTRDERRKASIEKLRARWGELAGSPSAKSELERHAKFVANLQRIRTLAEEKKKLKLHEKIDTLLTKEELRHSTQMNKLRDAAPAVAGGGK